MIDIWISMNINFQELTNTPSESSQRVEFKFFEKNLFPAYAHFVEEISCENITPF